MQPTQLSAGSDGGCDTVYNMQSFVQAVEARAADAAKPPIRMPPHGALLHATLMGDVDAAHRLLRRGAAVNEAVDGTTPLLVSVGSGSTDLVKLLLEARADVSKTEDDGASPVLIAAHLGLTQVLALLLAHAPTAIIHRARADGETPLSCSVRRAIQGSTAHYACAISLVKAGALEQPTVTTARHVPHLVSVAGSAARAKRGHELQQ